MSALLLIAVTVAYAGIAIDQGVKGNLPGATTWGGYAIANVGLWFTLK